MPRDATYGVKMKISRRAKYEKEHPNVLSAMHPVDKKNYLEGMFEKKDKVRFWCDRCNNWYFISIDAHKGGQLHSCDSAERQSRTKRSAGAKRFEFFDKIHPGDREAILKGELQVSAKMRFWCDRCNDWYYTWAPHVRRGNLHKCDKMKRAWITRRAGKNDKYLFDDLTEEYKEKVKKGEVGASDKVKFVCDKHGVYWQQLSSHARHNGCALCRAGQPNKARRRKDYPFMDEIRPDYQEKIKNGEIVQKTVIPFICDKHGEYWMDLSSKVQGSKCTLCNLEKNPNSFYEFLSTLTDNIIVNDRNQIFPYEIDFYLPNYRIGFEFNDIESHQTFVNGESINIQYNNGAKYTFAGKPSNYHRNKFLDCQKQGICLIQVWDIDWIDDRIRPVIEGIIKDKLGLNKHKIHAQDCEVVESNYAECNSFFLSNDLRGRPKGSGYYILKYKDGIVGAVCYTRRNKTGKKSDCRYADITINRMCFKQGVSVEGGADKLLDVIMELMLSGEIVEYPVLNDYFNNLPFEKPGWVEMRWRPMTKYYDYTNRHSLYRAPPKNATRKELSMNKKMSRYYTSGMTVYRKVVS